MTAEIINIGEEILLGIVTNTHAAFLGEQLSRLGFRVSRQTVIGDHPETIQSAVSESLSRADLLVLTGGLGPTSDDRTLATVAEMFGLDLVEDTEVLGNIERKLNRQGRPVPSLVRKQALVPKGASVFINANGTAPGFALAGDLLTQASPRKTTCLVCLPGPPRELLPMAEQGLFPLLQSKFPGLQPLLCRTVSITDMGESTVQDKVEARLRESFPGVDIGYCARPGEVDLRLTARTADSGIEAADSLARELLGTAVFGDGRIELETVVVELLKKAGKTVATAESCTGGALANRFTNVSGSSDVFSQGWITYSNDAKSRELGVSEAVLQEHGAVSEPVAREMARGARDRSGADYALSVTGIAGPTGGSPDRPVGTVYIGLASGAGVEVKKEWFEMDRWHFKWRVAQAALNMLRLALGSRR